MDWKDALPAASATFVQDIIDQIPEAGGARNAFIIILNRLASHVDTATQGKLDKLEALEDFGVDNWEGYAEAMADLEGEDEEDEDEDD